MSGFEDFLRQELAKTTPRNDCLADMSTTAWHEMALGHLGYILHARNNAGTTSGTTHDYGQSGLA